MLFLAQADASGSGSFAWLIYLVVFGGVAYFFMIRPQRTRIRQQQQLARELEVGHQVRTVGGLYGVVIGIDDDSVLLGVDEGRIRVAKGAVAGRTDTTSSPTSDATDGEA